MRNIIISAGMGFDISVPQQVEILSELGFDGMFSEWKQGVDLDFRGFAALALERAKRFREMID